MLSRSAITTIRLVNKWKVQRSPIRAGYRHHVVLATIVGTGLTLPFDVEPYGRGDSEYVAGQRLLRRAVELLGVRVAAYVVVDGEFATAPFLHLASKLSLPVVARLKANCRTYGQRRKSDFAPNAPNSPSVMERIASSLGMPRTSTLGKI